MSRKRDNVLGRNGSSKIKKQKTTPITYVVPLHSNQTPTEENKSIDESHIETNYNQSPRKSDLFTKLYLKIKQTDAVTEKERILCITKLYSLFCRTIEDCGISIIQNVLQKNLSQEQRSDGVAGGKKFYTQGIFYKFPAFFDGEYISILYKDEERAMKSAKLELQAIDQVISSEVEGAIVPLAACMDVFGYRLLALSNVSLPEEKTSNNEEDWCEDLKNIAKDLKRHLRVSLPADMDIFWLEEERQHLFLDLHRMFPAENALEHNDVVFDHIQQMKPIRRLNHVRRLRPELIHSRVSIDDLPLCSDAFMENKSTESENGRVKQIVSWLRNTLIPSTANTLPNTLTTSKEFINYLHSLGINLRYLGLLREHIPVSSLYKVICLKEMICRSLNSYIKKQMRNNAQQNKFTSIITNATQEITNWYNNTNSFWSTTIYELLTEKYINWSADCSWKIFDSNETPGITDLRLSLVPTHIRDTLESRKEIVDEGWMQFVKRFNEISAVEILPGKNDQSPLILNPVIRIKKLSNLMTGNCTPEVQDYIKNCEAKFSASRDPGFLGEVEVNMESLSKELVYNRLRVLSKPFEQNSKQGRNQITESACIRITDSHLHLFSSCTTQGFPIRSLQLNNEAASITQTNFNLPLNIVIDPCLIGGNFSKYERHTYDNVSAGDINLEIALMIQTKLQQLNDSGVLPCNVYLTRTTNEGLFLKDTSRLMSSSTEELVIRASECPSSISYILPLLEHALETNGDKLDPENIANANRLLNDEEYRQRANFVNNIDGGCDLFLSVYTGMDIIARDGYNYIIYLPGAVCVDEMRSPGHKEDLFRMLTSNVLEDSTRFASFLAQCLEENKKVPTREAKLSVKRSQDKEIVHNLIIPATCEDYSNCSSPIFHRNLRTLRIAQSKVTCYAELFDFENSSALEFVQQKDNIETLALCFVRAIQMFVDQQGLETPRMPTDNIQ